MRVCLSCFGEGGSHGSASAEFSIAVATMHLGAFWVELEGQVMFNMYFLGYSNGSDTMTDVTLGAFLKYFLCLPSDSWSVALTKERRLQLRKS